MSVLTDSTEGRKKVFNIQDIKFAIATREQLPNGDKWHSQPASYQDCKEVLISNGWNSTQAEHDLLEMYATSQFIPVNDFTQIC